MEYIFFGLNSLISYSCFGLLPKPLFDVPLLCNAYFRTYNYPGGSISEILRIVCYTLLLYINLQRGYSDGSFKHIKMNRMMEKQNNSSAFTWSLDLENIDKESMILNY